MCLLCERSTGKRFIQFSFLLIILIFVPSLETVSPPKNERTCQRIMIEDCRAILKYNKTGMPHFFGYETQEEVEIIYRSYMPLMRSDCSPYTQLFLCSAFVPMCNEKVEKLIAPCRPLCEHVRDGCSTLLEKFTMQWPAALNCSRFVAKNTGSSMCMLPEGMKYSKPKTVRRRPNSGAHNNFKGYHASGKPCAVFKASENYVLLGQRKSNDPANCAPKCSASVLWTFADKQTMEVWLAVWTALSLVASFFTVATFLLEPDRYDYPERTIIYIAFSYLIVGIVYVLRLAAGHEMVACEAIHKNETQRVLIQDGLQSTLCSIVFLLNYYFMTAGNIWWAVLALCFMLKYGMKWQSSCIHGKSQFFHLFAWCTPAAQTIAILIIRDVSADELTGLCEVGSYTKDTKLGFVIVPVTVYALIGLLCLLACAICHKSTTSPRNGREDISSSRALVFGLLYTVPMTCVLGANVYEHVNRQQWRRLDSPASPSIEIAMLKQFMTLVVGITCGVYTCSNDSFQLWCQFFYRTLCYRRKKQNTSHMVENVRTYNHYGYGPCLRGVNVHDRNAFHGYAYPMRNRDKMTVL